MFNYVNDFVDSRHCLSPDDGDKNVIFIGTSELPKLLLMASPYPPNTSSYESDGIPMCGRYRKSFYIVRYEYLKVLQ